MTDPPPMGPAPDMPPSMVPETVSGAADLFVYIDRDGTQHGPLTRDEWPAYAEEHRLPDPTAEPPVP